jgi:DNA polymerase III alpha subunit
VVVWNELYLEVSNVLVPGRVVEVKGTLDRRDEMFRATAAEIKPLTPPKTNGATDRSPGTSQRAILLRFSSTATGDELRQVRNILVSSPGPRPVQLLFDRDSGNSLQLDAGAEFRVNLTTELAEKLSRWLVADKRH